MLGEIPGKSPENQKKIFIEKDGRAEIQIPHVELDAVKDPLTLSVILVKEITPLQEEPSREEELPALAEMLGNARELRALPERQRPGALLHLLRSKVAYSYPDILASLGRTDSTLVEAIRDNNRTPFIEQAVFRRAVQLGYGNCQPLSVAMLYLGKEAGLEGAFLTNAPRLGKIEGADPNPITNVIRRDTHTRLFKMDERIGSNIPEGHAWVELRTSDGEWIPVDPATELVGDTEEGIATFKEANYRASVGLKLNMSPLPEGVQHFGTRDLEFLPGESDHTGRLKFNAKSKQETEPEITGHYEGPLHLQVWQWKPNPSLTVGVNYHIKSIRVER